MSLFYWCCPADPLKKLKPKSIFGYLAVTRVCQQVYIIIADSNIYQAAECYVEIRKPLL